MKTKGSLGGSASRSRGAGAGRAWKYAAFLLLTLVFFLLADLFAQRVFEPFFRRSGRFYLNDFEITQRDHPEAVWDRVFFGNSTVIAGFREDESSSGYVNLGLDDGTVRDLWSMIRSGAIHIGSELVIGVNELTLYDDFPTNPNYIWHRQWYKPYVLFNGVRFQNLIRDTAGELLFREERTFPFLGQQKNYYRGVMPRAEIEERLQSEHYRPYLSLETHDFDGNFTALEQILDWSARQGVRVRLLFMPCNPIGGLPQSRVCALERLEDFCESHSVELLDLHDALDGECFYDVGHLNREYGSHVFTKEIDSWLNS